MQLLDGLVGGGEPAAAQSVEQLLDPAVHLGRDARIVREPADGGAATGPEPGVHRAFEPGAEHGVGGEGPEVALCVLVPELQGDGGTWVVDRDPLGETDVEQVGVQMRPLVAVLVEPDRGAVLLQQPREPGHQVEELGGHGLAGHPASGDGAVGVLGGVPPQPLAEAALRADPAGRGGVGGPAAQEQPQPGGRVVLRFGEQVEQGGGPVVGRRVRGERGERRVEQPVRHGLAAGGGEHLAQHPRLLVGAEPGRTRGIPDPAGQIGGQLARRRRPDGQQPYELAVRVPRFEHLGQPGRDAAELGGGKCAEPGEQLKVRPPPVGIDGQTVRTLRSARVRVRAGGGTAVRLQHPVPDGVPEPRQMGRRQPPRQAPRLVHEPTGLLPGSAPAAARLLQHVTSTGLGAGDPGARPVDVGLGDAVIGRERNGSSGAAGHVYQSGSRH
ncbi:hypothetical protein GCM10015535_67820 [Streptomyces gelaticus]|uniref:Uncharacterized protein n=1 Tax=Streptomyces gelaticus TaxID=285446 RepID=A0ABQ2WBV8_9ACTN|nr:hypothetical protein [Streptomyces gelaticus]GGV97114.1 hypothetical protein GCM10015535_67820 [Streptomyces gelaticus]